MLKKMRDLKKSRRGFTLVEIIVVLVILAILAAFTIPAMLGFVNDARAKASIAQAREVDVAAQSAATTVASDASHGGTLSASASTTTGSDAATIQSQIVKLVTGDLSGITTSVNVVATYTAPTTKGTNNTAVVYIDTNAKVKGVLFTDSNGYSLLLNNGGTTTVLS